MAKTFYNTSKKIQQNFEKEKQLEGNSENIQTNLNDLNRTTDLLWNGLSAKKVQLLTTYQKTLTIDVTPAQVIGISGTRDLGPPIGIQTAGGQTIVPQYPGNPGILWTLPNSWYPAVEYGSIVDWGLGLAFAFVNPTYGLLLESVKIINHWGFSANYSEVIPVSMLDPLKYILIQNSRVTFSNDKVFSVAGNQNYLPNSGIAITSITDGKGRITCSVNGGSVGNTGYYSNYFDLSVKFELFIYAIEIS
jgi:hypothetical protein